MDAQSGGLSDAVVEEARRQLRAPWAASVAGLLFAILFTASLAFMRQPSIYDADNAQLIRIYNTGGDVGILIGGLYLAPFAGIMFLWFVAVIRDQIGEREDRFFATVFFGSGVLFVAVLFIAAALASAPSVGFRYLGVPPPSSEEIGLVRSIGYTLAFAFATRAAAVFMFATATIGLRSGAFPRWVAITGYLLGLVLLIAVTFFELAVLVLPAWVAVVSVLILRRERARSRAGTG